MVMRVIPAKTSFPCLCAAHLLMYGWVPKRPFVCGLGIRDSCFRMKVSMDTKKLYNFTQFGITYTYKYLDMKIIQLPY